MPALLKSKGIEPGDRVGLMMPNVPYFPAIYFGILRAGGVVVPMNVLLKGREVAFYLEDPGAKLVFAWGDFGEAAEAGAEKAGAEVILVKPGEFEKLLAEQEPDTEMSGRAERGHRRDPLHVGHHRPAEGRRAHAREPVQATPPGVSEKLGELNAEDVLLGALPLFHSFGQTCTMNSRRLRRRHGHDAAALRPGQGARDHAGRDKVTIFQGVPTMYNAMLHSGSADDGGLLVAPHLHVRRRGDARPS